MKAAFLDIGTNSVRFLAVEYRDGGGFSILDRGLAASRLGEGLSGPGVLRPRAVERTLAALERIGERCSEIGVEARRAVGTEVLRLAGNAAGFLRGAAELGFRVEIISGEEEALLVRRGALGGFSVRDRQAALADIGGGSTELIPPGPAPPVSLSLGAVRLKEKFSPGREPGPEEIRRMERHTHAVLAELPESFPSPGALVGLGGTFTTLAAVRLGLTVYDGDRVHGLEMERTEIEAIFRRLAALSLADRRRLPGLKPARADIIIPGTVIVLAVLERFSLSRVAVSDRGLLFGLAAEGSG